MVAEVEKAWSGVDILVNNAGVLPERRSGEVGIPAFVGSDPKHWQKFVDLNFVAVMNCVDAVGKGMMARRRGKILTIVSDAGRVGEARLAAYSGAKAAAIGFTKALAKELGTLAHQRQLRLTLRRCARGADGRFLGASTLPLTPTKRWRRS